MLRVDTQTISTSRLRPKPIEFDEDTEIHGTTDGHTPARDWHNKVHSKRRYVDMGIHIYTAGKQVDTQILLLHVLG